MSPSCPTKLPLQPSSGSGSGRQGRAAWKAVRKGDHEERDLYFFIFIFFKDFHFIYLREQGGGAEGEGERVPSRPCAERGA